MKSNYSLTVVAAAAAALLAAPAAHAQDAPAPASTAKKADDPGADSGVIIVTANRREEDQQKVSGVVQVVTGDQLRKDGVTEVRQLQTLIPGMSISTQEGAVDVYIRGVGTGNNTELGDPGAAPHINGIYIPRPRGLGLMFFDLERVEVNKGPQGTLYGRNALAGTLNIITAKPKFGQSGGYVQTEAGNRDGRAMEGALNIPVSDNLAMRMAFTYVNKDYGYKNVSEDPRASENKPAGLEENYGGRLSLLWDATDSLRFSAMIDGGHEGGTGYPGANIYQAVHNTGLTPDHFDMRNVLYRGPQGELSNDLWGIQAKANYDFGGFEGEFSASVRDVDFYQRNASSAGIDYPGLDQSTIDWDNFTTVYWITKSRSEIGELRLFNTDPAAALKWTAGAFAFGERQKSAFFSLADHGYCCYSGTEFTMPKVLGDSAAVYADGTWAVSPSLRALAGARFSREHKYRYGIGGNYALTLGGENYDCCIGTRFGTEGFVPALLSRRDFDVSKLKTAQDFALFLINATKTPGARDTMIDQIKAIADGSNPYGTCFIRDDISNGKTCPVNNPGDHNGGFSFVNLAIPQQQEGRSSAKYGDFRIGFEADLSKDHMVYGKISTAHKAGGFNDSLNQVDAPLVYKPEKLVVYEAGTRNVFGFNGRRAVVNASAFFYDYKDQVLQDLACTNVGIGDGGDPECTGFSLVNRNVGGSHVKGLEAELKLPIGQSTTFDLNAAWLDARFTKGVVADARAIDYGNGGKSPLIDISGNTLPLASRFNLMARVSQRFALGGGSFDWQAVASYRSSYYLNQFNEDDIVYLDGHRETALQAGFPDRQEGYTQFNLGLGYQFGDWRVEGFANNVTNETASQKEIAGPNLNLRYLNDARSFGARVRYNF